MIDGALHWLAARYWRRRIAKREAEAEQWTADFMKWKRENPDRCMYCAYTGWANEVQGLRLPLDPHVCVEGKSPAEPLPRAEIRS